MGHSRPLSSCPFGVRGLVGTGQRVEPAAVRGVGVKDLAAEQREGTDPGRLLAGMVLVGEVVGGAVRLLLGRERHPEVAVEVARCRREPRKRPAHACLVRGGFASGARDTQTKVTSRCARCTLRPSYVSAQNEQLGQPSSQSGPYMKWYTRSWLRPSRVRPSCVARRAPSKAVVLFDAHPRQRPALRGGWSLTAVEVLLVGEELEARRPATRRGTRRSARSRCATEERDQRFGGGRGERVRGTRGRSGRAGPRR